MSSGPRSQRLLAWNFTAAGGSPLFLSPVGMVTLVKSVVFYNSGAAPAHLTVYLHYSGPVTIISNQETIDPGKAFHWEGWLVLNPQDGVSCYCDVAGGAVAIAGAVLIGAPPVVPAELNNPVVFADLPAATPAAGTSPSPVIPTVQRTVRASRRR